ncbi:MAG TPA: gliding motility-associated C-terminal domain-containing protein, partial [Chryseosolibacter sp.]
TFSGNTITPENAFAGILTVSVTVNDGHASSDPFGLKIEVISKGRLEIIGQAFLQIPEDSSLTLGLSDLVVNDPDHVFPQGFGLHVNPGENYDVVNTTIKPHRDFSGKLVLPVAVSNAAGTSPVYPLVIVVAPVNDAPELSGIEQEPLVVNGSAPLVVTSSIEVTDRDDDQLLYGEIRIDAAGYRRGQDQLLFDVSENIRGVFEADSGMLFLFGRASLAEYQDVLRSVQYTFEDSSASGQPSGSKKITFKVSDGKTTSPGGERTIVFDTDTGLEIPSAFTPNNDFANDTWKITPRLALDERDTRIRVYDGKGNVVFQCSGFQTEWDGQFNGSPLPAGVYFYTIEMHLSQKMINYKGTVAILR